MSSLKRLLNDDFSEDPSQRFDWERLKQVRGGDLVLNDTPVMAEQSWAELWDGILSADFVDGNPSLQMTCDEGFGAAVHNVEQGIELWASQSLPPLAKDPSSDLRSSFVEPSSAYLLPSSVELRCYGMIYRAAVKVVGNMLGVDTKLNLGNSTLDREYFTFKIVKSATEVFLKFQDNTEFGLLNSHTSRALLHVIDQTSIQFDAIGSIITLRETIGRAAKASDAVVRVDINVYGSKEASKDVGRHLSAHHVFLQRPDRTRPGSVYDNPHVLKFADMQMSSHENHLDLVVPRVSASGDAEEFQQTISEVYASLTRSTKLNRVKGDRRLGTQLLPHQQEALDFMIQRENGPLPPEFCLWKPMVGDNEGGYLHAVTKAKSRTESVETGGGILADDMGMGKTLSVLALITKTIEDGFQWIHSPGKDNPEETERRKIPIRATLVIVPSGMLINEWLNEIKIHLDGTLRIVKYHGQRRNTLVSAIEEADIVLTTYHTLVADFGEKSSPVYEVEWFRIVLDEAHIIRRQKTTFFKAVTELRGRSRWCLTGTPIQNRLEDVGALFAFIRARPFHILAMFRRFVTIPFEESAERRAVATRNLTLLLDSLCLRRSGDLLHLPEPQERVRFIEFSKEERDQYEQTKKTMNRALRQRVGEAYSQSQSIFGMFQVQLQLRILCNHGTYQHPFSWTKRSLLDEREDALCLIGGSGEVNCSVCREPMPILGSNNIYRTYPGNCAHILCSDCLDEDETSIGEGGDKTRKCPLCTISGVPPFTAGGIQHDSTTDGRHDSYLRSEGQSSKMNSLICDIREDLWKTKSIIFSCWTNTLNLMERYLRRDSIPFQRIDGECPLGRRQKILDDFSKPSGVPILIMTTGTGAFGLNLTSANRVFIIEPQWNPSVENQAIARAIRLNQVQSVLVTRYMVKGTVEQEMRSQQERKKRIAGVGTNTSN